MSGILEVAGVSWSDIVCGENCWYAKQETCQCSCLGKNHGILRNDENAKVERTAKLEGNLYKLVAVGQRKDLYAEQYQLLLTYGLREVRRKGYYGNEEDLPENVYHRYYADDHGDATRGYPVKIKYATLAQATKWKELAYLKVKDRQDLYHGNVCLLWQIVTAPKPVECDCGQCPGPRGGTGNNVSKDQTGGENE